MSGPWIACSEQLPELIPYAHTRIKAMSKWVLVYHSGSSEPRISVLQLYQLADGTLKWADDEISWGIGGGTHWMPLPEPPK